MAWEKGLCIRVGAGPPEFLAFCCLLGLQKAKKLFEQDSVLQSNGALVYLFAHIYLRD